MLRRNSRHKMVFPRIYTWIELSTLLHERNRQIWWKRNQCLGQHNVPQSYHVYDVGIVNAYRYRYEILEASVKLLWGSVGPDFMLRLWTTMRGHIDLTLYMIFLKKTIFAVIILEVSGPQYYFTWLDGREEPLHIVTPSSQGLSGVKSNAFNKKRLCLHKHLLTS